MSLAFKISPENLMGDFGYMESWSKGTSVPPDGWAAVGTPGSIARESTIKKFGNYSMKITAGAANEYATEYRYDITTRKVKTLSDSIIGDVFFPGRTITFGCWVKCDTASKARIYINDGVSRVNSSFHTGSDDWEFLTIEIQTDSNMNKLQFGCEVASNAIVAYFDGGIFVNGELLFTDFRDDTIYVREQDWQPRVSFVVSKFNIARREGIIIDDAKFNEKRITLRVQIYSDDFETARGLFDDIIKACANGRKDLLFADDRLVKVFLINLPQLTYMARARVYTFNLQFTAPEPFERYVARLRNSEDVTASSQSFNLEVIGNMETLPIIWFLPDGTTLTSITLENLTTGQSMSYSDSIAVGGTLRINTDTLEVINDGVDGLSYLTGDFLKLIPGTNFLKFTGTTPCTVRVDHFDKVPMIYRIELRDRDNDFVAVIDNRAQNLRWAYNRVGGCAAFSFDVSRRYCSELALGANFNVRISAKNLSTNNYDLKYQGRIENRTNKVTGRKETIGVDGFGYQSELKDIIINQNYSSQEISVIVKAVLDNFIVPNTNITYDADDIENTSFTADSLEFSYVTAQEVMKKLADIVGSREWGVDKDKKFFFKQKTTDTNTFYSFGDKKILNFDLDGSSREIINRVIVIGGDVAGTKFIYTKDYSANQLKYKRRDKVIQNSAVVSNTVAEQLADAEQAKGDGVVDRGRVTIRDEIFLEDTIPIPLIKIKTREILWDERNWDEFLWAGQAAFEVNKIGYKINKDSSLILNVNIGQLLPSNTEDINRLKFELDQLTQARS